MTIRTPDRCSLMTSFPAHRDFSGDSLLRFRKMAQTTDRKAGNSSPRGVIPTWHWAPVSAYGSVGANGPQFPRTGPSPRMRRNKPPVCLHRLIHLPSLL
ncbi:hypothetical protein RB213_015243 [Colletotrichum asianum]